MVQTLLTGYVSSKELNVVRRVTCIVHEVIPLNQHFLRI